MLKLFKWILLLFLGFVALVVLLNLIILLLAV